MKINYEYDSQDMVFLTKKQKECRVKDFQYQIECEISKLEYSVGDDTTEGEINEINDKIKELEDIASSAKEEINFLVDMEENALYENMDDKSNVDFIFNKIKNLISEKDNQNKRVLVFKSK